MTFARGGIVQHSNDGTPIILSSGDHVIPTGMTRHLSKETLERLNRMMSTENPETEHLQEADVPDVTEEEVEAENVVTDVSVPQDDEGIVGLATEVPDE